MSKNQPNPNSTKGQYRKKVNILLVEIINRNLGDAVIADNAAYLVQKGIPFWLRCHFVLQRYKMDSKDFEMVKAADMVVFAGGGIIKYKYEHFYESISEIIQCTQEYGIPVYFNSVGIEGYDSQDERCLRLKAALNSNCVKAITVRDDLKTLQQCYLEPELHSVFTAGVIDPAVYTPDVYQVEKKGQTNTIGLGIVRYRIFEDNGLPQVTKEIQLELWSGIAKELEARGYQWQFFVNGLRSDYDFAEEVLAYMGREAEAKELLVERPVAADELVRTIAGFDGLIACRMHANIIAYSLGVPSVGLVWNDKLLFWGERIGYSQRFFTYDQFEPGRIVQCMVDSIAQGTGSCDAKLKKSVRKPLRKFIHQYGKAAWKKNRSNMDCQVVPWKDKLVATALGGLALRYANLNSVQGLEAAILHGFQNFEADIRLTTDGKLVCVNGWSKASYEKLGLEPQEYTSDGMAYDAFMSCGLYGNHFQVMDAEQLFRRMSRFGHETGTGRWNLILDIGKPKKEVLAAMLPAFKELCNLYPACKGHLFIRLQGKYDVEAVKEAGLAMELMYYVPPRQKREEKNLTMDSIVKYCKKQGVKWVSMPKEALEEEVMASLKKHNLKSCVFSYNTYTEAKQALEMGVDWVSTCYLSVNELEGWYES